MDNSPEEITSQVAPSDRDKHEKKGRNKKLIMALIFKALRIRIRTILGAIAVIILIVLYGVQSTRIDHLEAQKHEVLGENFSNVHVLPETSNLTIVEKIEKLSTQNRHLKMDVNTLTERVQLVNTSQQELDEKIFNISSVHSSLKSQQDTFTSQLASVNKTVNDIDRKVSVIESEQRDQDDTLSTHEQKIVTLQDEIAELRNSSSSSITLLPMSLSVNVLCIILAA